jgi:hypothetical protein
MSSRLSGWTVVRRVVLVVLYLVSATLIIAYANGYVFDLSTQRLEHTGIINLTVKQMPVAVVVNGKKKLYKRTPINLSYLFPGDYTVEIQKDGYFTWSKVMHVPSGQVVINPFIKLFYTKSPPTPASQNDIDFLTSRVKPAIVTDLDVRGNEIWVKPVIRTYPFIVTDDHFTLIGRFSEPVDDAVWNPDKTHVVYQRGLDLHIMDRDGSNDHVLTSLNTAGPTTFAISNDGDRLIYKDGDSYFVRQIM